MRISSIPTPRRAAVPLLLAALCASGGGLRAQRLPSVQPGDRVRVTAPELPKRVGTVVAVRADTLVFRGPDADAPLSLSIPGVSLLQVPRGKHGPLRGALIGTGAGALAGYAAAGALVAGEDCGGGDCYTGRVFAAFFVWAGATVAGGVGGALIAADTERWTSVPLTSLTAAGAVTVPAALPAGALVRVSAPGAAARPVEGRVVGVRGDSLVLLEPGGRGEILVPLVAVRTVEVGRGGDPNGSALRGLVLGTAAGALGFGAIGFASASGDPQGPSRLANAAWVGGILGVPLGAVVGGLAGHRRGTLRWMPLPPVARMTVAPGGNGGVAVGLTLPAR